MTDDVDPWVRLIVADADPRSVRAALLDGWQSVANFIEVHPLGTESAEVSADVKGDAAGAAEFRTEVRDRLKQAGLKSVRIKKASARSTCGRTRGR